MTLITALRCPDGVVMTSDSRETRGPQQRRLAGSVTKIYSPRAGFLVAWAGWANVAQAFALAMARTSDLSPSFDRVHVKRRLEQLIAEVRRGGDTDEAEWIVTWWSEPDDGPVALRLFSGRAGEWIEQWGFGGDERPREIAHIVAEAISFVPRGTLTLEQAKLLALKVMRDTIRIGVESIGGEAQLATVSKEGVEIITGTDLEGLHDALDVWQEQAAALLPGSIPVPAESTTPDRGVRPPARPPNQGS